MNPVPRPMVVTAGIVLAGVSVLGLYLGIQPSLEHLPGETAAAPAPSAAAAMAPGARTVEATALKTDTPLPSAAPPASSTLAAVGKPKTKSTDADEAPDSDAPPAGAQARKAGPPEPPTLYSPDEAPAPAPAGESGANTPPY